jgi:hypothetical protein
LGALLDYLTENYIGVLNFKVHELKLQFAVLNLINGKLNFGRKFQYLIFKLQNLFHNLQNLTAFREQQQIAELDLKIQITLLSPEDQSVAVWGLTKFRPENQRLSESQSKSRSEKLST